MAEKSSISTRLQVWDTFQEGHQHVQAKVFLLFFNEGVVITYKIPTDVSYYNHASIRDKQIRETKLFTDNPDKGGSSGNHKTRDVDNLGGKMMGKYYMTRNAEYSSEEWIFNQTLAENGPHLIPQNISIKPTETLWKRQPPYCIGR